MDELRITFEGGAELDRLLAELGDRRSSRRIVLGGLRAAAVEVKAAARRAAPARAGSDERPIRFREGSLKARGPGFLRRSVVYRSLPGPEAAIVVGPRRAAWYGRLFERGRAGRPFPLVPWFTQAVSSARASLAGIVARATARELDRELERILKRTGRGRGRRRGR